MFIVQVQADLMNRIRALEFLFFFYILANESISVLSSHQIQKDPSARFYLKALCVQLRLISASIYLYKFQFGCRRSLSRRALLFSVSQYLYLYLLYTVRSPHGDKMHHVFVSARYFYVYVFFWPSANWNKMPASRTNLTS